MPECRRTSHSGIVSFTGSPLRQSGIGIPASPSVRYRWSRIIPVVPSYDSFDVNIFVPVAPDRGPTFWLISSLPKSDFSGVRPATRRLQFDYQLPWGQQAHQFFASGLLPPPKRQTETYKQVFFMLICVLPQACSIDLWPATITLMGSKGKNYDYILTVNLIKKL
jgi:hypothetical protein